MIKQRRVVVYIPDEQHKKLKSVLALTGQNISAWFRSMVKILIGE